MKIHVRLKDGIKLELQRFGNDLICVSPPSGFNKEREDYINLKKGLFDILFCAKNKVL